MILSISKVPLQNLHLNPQNWAILLQNMEIWSDFRSLEGSQDPLTLPENINLQSKTFGGYIQCISDYNSDDNSGVSSNLDVLWGFLQSERKKKHKELHMLLQSWWRRNWVATWWSNYSGNLCQTPGSRANPGKSLDLSWLNLRKVGKNIW